jgi:hypothetical protein
MCTVAIARTGLWRVVFALSSEELAAITPAGGFPDVPLEGPADLEEARAAVAGYL